MTRKYWILGNNSGELLIGDLGQPVGNNWMEGYGGNDRVIGDRQFLQQNGGDDRVGGGMGDDEVMGDAEILEGCSGGEDIVHGWFGNDWLWGDALYATNSRGGDDYLNGWVGDDKLFGDFGYAVNSTGGDDDLRGSWGNDVLWGDWKYCNDDSQGGDDDLRGGLGSDTFGFAANFGEDKIHDFNAKEDTLLFSEDLRGTLTVSQSLKPNSSTFITAQDGSSIELIGVNIQDVNKEAFTFYDQAM